MSSGEESGGEGPGSSPHPGLETALRVLGGLLALGAGVPWLLLVVSVIASRFGDPQGGPHGYMLLFGPVLALPCGLIAALGAGLVAPRSRRVRVMGPAFLATVAIWVVLLVLLVTA